MVRISENKGKETEEELEGALEPVGELGELGELGEPEELGVGATGTMEGWPKGG